jgi:stearoyl-CoA desaturase (delta-9 desaturase)
VQVANLLAVILPFLGLVVAIVIFWGWGVSWVDLALLVGMYLLTGVGITVGFHRLFTHRSFETNRFVQFVLAALGSMALEGPLFRWVATHRRHHQCSDTGEDPHSPHHQGTGILGLLRGIWHSHVGWIFQFDIPNLERYVKDLVLVGLVIPAVLGGLLTLSWMGVLFGLLWGGLVRIFFIHHITWSINSVCHIWGRRPYPSNDESRNNFLFGILGLGEGWHNNHHAFPTSARHGLRWWEFDISYLLIRGLALLGLAWNVKLPSPALLAGHNA